MRLITPCIEVICPDSDPPDTTPRRGHKRILLPMSEQPFGVLIHGAGWVSTQHIAAFNRNPAARVLAVCSHTRAGAERRITEAGIAEAAAYDDFSRALRHPGVDIVSICTPQHLHYENVLEAAAAGKHLVIEKPAALSMEELERMRAAVERTGVRTVVSFVLRWNPLVRTLKSLSAEGAFGRIYSVEADYLSHNGPWWAGWKDTCSRRNGVSAMLVAGCHAIDTVRWLASGGEPRPANPVEVFAMAGGYRKGQTEAYDPTTNTWVTGVPPMEYDGLEVALIQFDNGVLGKVSVNFDCVMPYRLPLRLFGDRGTAMDNRVWSRKFPDQRDWVELPVIQPDSSDVHHHPFQAQMDHFLDCLRRGVESHCNLADAIQTHCVVFAALESYRTRRPVSLRPAAGGVR